jgi:transcriptional regulator with XRE-family HTH domain/quercetin dioxygenase-like cupin family protein
MNAMATPTGPVREDPLAVVVDIGVNIRSYRTQRGMSVRELARRVGISASALSQIEIGRSRPSVSTLYEITQQLGATPNEIFFGSSPARALPEDAVLLQNGLDAHLGGILEFVPKAAQHVVTLKGGESCRQLGGNSLPGVDCVRITYEPGAISPGPDEYVRHAGHEFNYLLSGDLTLIIGPNWYRMSAGDSLTFPSDWPHRVLNQSDQIADVVCLFVRGAAVPVYEGGASPS